MKNWLRSELKPLMTRLLAPDRLRERGLIEPAEVTRLIDAALRRAGQSRARALQSDGVRAVGRIGCRQVLTGS